MLNLFDVDEDIIFDDLDEVTFFLPYYASMRFFLCIRYAISIPTCCLTHIPFSMLIGCVHCSLLLLYAWGNHL